MLIDHLLATTYVKQHNPIHMLKKNIDIFFYLIPFPYIEFFCIWVEIQTCLAFQIASCTRQEGYRRKIHLSILINIINRQKLLNDKEILILPISCLLQLIYDGTPLHLRYGNDNPRFPGNKFYFV